LGAHHRAGQEGNLAIPISDVDTQTGEMVEADTIVNSAYDWTSIGPANGKVPEG
jgi:hypothetical protein